MKKQAIVVLVVLTVISGIIIAYLATGASQVVGPEGSETLRFSGVLDEASDYNLHSVRVLENVTSMRVVLTAYGDFDLYCKLGAVPSLGDYDFKCINYGNEDYTYESPVAGIWYFMVRAYEGAGHYDFTVILN
jgi:hypothetical protein